jgi:hypothetical protein
MQPVDRPFRLSLDFSIVWSVLAVPAFFLIRRADIGPWFSQAAALILLPLFGTFVLYGPVLLARQIVGSGSRGRFVARVFVSFLVVAALCAAIMFFTGQGEHPSWWCGTASWVAISYLQWMLEPRCYNGRASGICL